MEKSPSLCKPCSSDELFRRRPFSFDLQRFADGDKTEEPTAKKREEAAKKGQVGKSQEVSTAFVLLIGFFVIKALWERIYANIAEYTVYIFGHLNQTIDVETVLNLFIGMVFVLGQTAFPIMIAVMIVGLAVNIFQGGWHFNSEKLEPKLDNLNPINGFGRLFSKRSLVELVKSLLKIAIIGFFIYNYLKDEIFTMPQFIFYDLTTSLSKISDIIFGLVFQVIGVIMILAFADLAYQKWQTTQDLKMTKQEVKDEFKQVEGDPQIKGKIRQKQRQMAMSRMMQEVPKADVIVTNPTHFAVALKYEKGMMAPKVVAKGADFVAQKIKSVGRENDVPLVENRPLARALYASAEVGDFVPRELYQSVAEVLAYVYRLKHRRRRA
ncbi:flagellar biosynthesis protein FlhB [Selenomonas sp.]|uniref:flagellar biosynthesis protein FlhB n=1 Tax=Selenomonas sp. TaxID=2053611 RepID=UPI0025F74A5D|nr:flagellar biosynthesis protein FlhB [Selenomonas sp.]MCI6084779.1 flagellar biosynthesis protein FlhB [Selenomonas sp.]MDY3298380.1 flagellar biosynthesis protein FlhB [Selenomonas sp.]MDY4416724.1 flagellar biosynthesis protein FlhB [Selenomonas sp.]